MKKLLQEVRDKVAAGWCQGPVAMTASDIATYACDPAAVRWCLFGAVTAVTYYADIAAFHELEALLNRVARARHEYGYVSFSEEPGRTVEEVLAFLDEVIRRHCD